MDLQDKIDQIVALIEDARAVPMSASCMINRTEVLGLLTELSGMLPEEIRESRFLLRDRDGVIEEGKREAERIVAEAYAERDVLVHETAIVAEAEREADRIIGDGERLAERMRAEVDEYIDAKLAHFEVLRHRTIT